MPSDIGAALEATVTETEFSGVVSVERAGSVEFTGAFGFAQRALRVPNTVDTRFAIASGSKGLTALTVAALVERGALGMNTTARSVLGPDLPVVDDAVTVRHLLAHRSGIGDFLDEYASHDITDHVLPVSPHELADTEQYLPVLAGHPAKFAPDTGFSYCNSGYVILALIAERVGGQPFHALVRDLVCGPAGMPDRGFPRADALPGRTALGYLTRPPDLRTNVFHLPVRGSGDGGAHSTAADVNSFWHALFDGRIVGVDLVGEMTRPHSEVPRYEMRYGLGFWLHPSRDTVMLEGYDAGVSFRSVHDRASGTTHTVIANWPDGGVAGHPPARRPPLHRTLLVSGCAGRSRDNHSRGSPGGQPKTCSGGEHRRGEAARASRELKPAHHARKPVPH